jgi:hypothetical protein
MLGVTRIHINAVRIGSTSGWKKRRKRSVNVAEVDRVDEDMNRAPKMDRLTQDVQPAPMEKESEAGASWGILRALFVRMFTL